MISGRWPLIKVPGLVISDEDTRVSNGYKIAFNRHNATESVTAVLIVAKAICLGFNGGIYMNEEMLCFRDVYFQTGSYLGDDVMSEHRMEGALLSNSLRLNVRVNPNHINSRPI